MVLVPMLKWTLLKFRTLETQDWHQFLYFDALFSHKEKGMLHHLVYVKSQRVAFQLPFLVGVTKEKLLRYTDIPQKREMVWPFKLYLMRMASIQEMYCCKYGRSVLYWRCYARVAYKMRQASSCAFGIESKSQHHRAMLSIPPIYMHHLNDFSKSCNKPYRKRGQSF